MEKTAPKKLYHRPVMLPEVLNAFAALPEGWVVDGTFGDGGHSKEIYSHLHESHRLISVDWDFSGYTAFLTQEGPKPEKLDDAKKNSEWIIVKDNFAHIDSILKEVARKLGNKEIKFAGILLDLGISSRQFVQKQRGFSFTGHGKADMRMDPETYSVAAYDLLNALSYKKLSQLFQQTVGMNQVMAAKVAHEIVEVRETKLFGNTDDIQRLNEIAYKTVPIRGSSKGRIHPATLLFLALRVAVNSELQNLQEVLPAALSLLVPGGKIAVMSYHSAEEQIIQRFLTENKISAEVLLPSASEVKSNPRARSAKLFIITK